MGLIDKIRNASLQRRINKRIQENNISQATPEVVVQAIVEETMNNKVLVENTKTLQRLGILETASTWNIEQTLNHNKSIINLQTRVTTLEKIIEDQPKTKRADEVLDTSDNTYKDVRHIQVNRATKADMVLWPDTNEYYPVDELPFLTKYLTVNGGTITGNLEVNNRLTMNGELVATQKWVQEHGGGGGGSTPSDLETRVDELEQHLNEHISDYESFQEDWLQFASEFSNLKNNAMTINTEQEVSGNKTFKIVPSSIQEATSPKHLTTKRYVDDAIAQAQLSGTVNLKDYVRKDETLKQLCEIEKCAWATDITRQIDDNGLLIGNMWDKGLVGGNAFGNVDQHIATKEWVEEQLAERPSDQPSQSIDKEELVKLVQNVGVHTGAVQWTASNIPENATGPGIDPSKVWKAKYRFDGVIFKGNEYLEEDTRETLLKWPKHRVYNNIGEEVSDYNIATEQFIVPKRHAINVIYNFGDTTNIKRIQTGIDSNHIKRAIFQIKPWYNVLQSHWSQYEVKPAWKDLEKWIPIGSYSWDFVRDDRGYIAYEWLNYCDVTFRYGDRGSLMVYVTCTNSGWNAETFLDNLIIEFDKIGSHLKITNDPTLDNQYKLPAYIWNEE